MAARATISAFRGGRRRAARGGGLVVSRAARVSQLGLSQGGVEPGEDPLVAARREVREETLVTDLEFEWVSLPGDRSLRAQEDRQVLPGGDPYRQDLTAGEPRAGAAGT